MVLAACNETAAVNITADPDREAAGELDAPGDDDRSDAAVDAETGDPDGEGDTADGEPPNDTEDDADDGDAVSENDDEGDGARCPTSVPPGAGIVFTEAGPVRGFPAGTGYAFLGIPYAAPPVGERRFAPPAPPLCIDGVLTAAAFPPACKQKSFERGPNFQTVESIQGREDCLFLNIWTPGPLDATPAPVLLFIHGGGNQQGSTNEVAAGVRLYEGEDLSAAAGAVVVTVQYRLGAFGWLAHPGLTGPDDPQGTGNYALRDLIAALTWVRDEIGRFGGDARRVTVFGESAGAVNVCTLVNTPAARELFVGAVMQSGGCTARNVERRHAEAATFARAVGCGDAATAGACLRAASADALVAPLKSPFSAGFVDGQFGATVDGTLLAVDPLTSMISGRRSPVPFIIGANSDETGSSIAPGSVRPADVDAFAARWPEPFRSEILALYPPGTTNAQARASLVQATTDFQFVCPARALARFAAPTGPTYRYVFEHRFSTPLGQIQGAFHGIELFYVFQTLGRVPDFRPTEDDRAVERWMAAAWGAFATGGNPGSGGSPWARYDTAGDAFMRINAAPAMGADYRKAECDMWERVYAASTAP